MINDSDELTAHGGRAIGEEARGRLVMDFNPLMLLAGNLTSIIQGSGEEGLRKKERLSKREREGRKKGGEVGKDGGGEEDRAGGSTDALVECSRGHSPLLQLPQAPLQSMKHHPH